jgi:P-type Ca2+ transporter type 2C
MKRGVGKRSSKARSISKSSSDIKSIHIEKPQGLSVQEAHNLLLTYGPNEIKTAKINSPLQILWHQVRSNYVIYLLIVSFAIAWFLGKTETAYTVLGVIIIVVTVGFFQEYKAERAIEALKNLITDTTTVIRGGSEKEIPTTGIVPGDTIVLRTGDKIPADCELIESHDLKINESMLTGESAEVYKDSKDAKNNNIFAGTEHLSQAANA